MEEIVLSASRASWQQPAHHGTEQDAAAKMKETRPKIFSRDKNQCRYCGFISSKWQEVHHLDDDHLNFDLANLATACPLCHQCFHLGVAGSSGGGRLVWLPEIGQIELNHLARAVFVAKAEEGNKMAGSAQALFSALESRAAFLEQQFCPGASDPAFLGQVFLRLKDKYEKRKEFLSGIRLLAYPSRFGPQVKHWAENVFRDMPPASWSRLIERAAEKIG